MRCKYLTIQDGLGGTYQVYFPEHIEHAAMAQLLCPPTTPSLGRVITAGFVVITDGPRAICFGAASSLGLQTSDDDSDTDLANLQFFGSANPPRYGL